MNEETIHNLESLGFTNYESKVFCALFEGHTMSGSEIAKAAKIPRSSAYDILKSFTQKGICNEIQTSSVVLYELIDPKFVEDKIEREIHDTYKNRINKLKDSFEKLQPLFKSKEKKSEKIDVELIKGFNRHRAFKFLQLLKESQTELLLMNRLEGYVSKESDESSIDFIKRGGIILSLYELNYNFKIQGSDDKWKDVDSQGIIELCENFMKNGEQIKLAHQVHQNLAIFDRKIVYVSLVDPEVPVYNRSDVIINNPNYANAMVEYFNSCWDNASTVEEFKKEINQSSAESGKGVNK